MTGNIWSLSGRLQLLWDSPIIAGTVCAMLAPWLHAAAGWRGGSPWRKSLVIGSVLIELAVLGCLVLTQSRGPLLAWMLATTGRVVHALLAVPHLRREMVIRSLGALAFVVLGSLMTAARGRIIEGIALQDQSVVNRLHVWSASLDMLWLNPWTGLGAGEAGWTYSQWFQTAASPYLYTGILNGLLEIGIEKGVVVLWLVLAGTSAIVLYPWLARRSEKPSGAPPVMALLGMCSWVSLTVYFAANLTSSLHKSPTLIALALVGLAAFVSFMVLIRDRRAIRRAVLWAALSATVVLFMLRLLPLLNRREITIACDRSAVVMNKPKASANPAAAAVLVDRSVLGPLFGLELRKLFQERADFDSWLVFDPRHPLPQERLLPPRHVIATGRCIRFLRLLDPKHAHEILLINPEGVPMEFPESWVVRVFLPGGDELGQNARWLALAHPPKITVQVHGQGGQLLAGGRLEWPKK